MRARLVAAALAMMTTAVPALAEGQTCTLREVTSLRLDMNSDGRVRIPVRLNQKPFKMLVDTGAYISVLFWPAVEALDAKQHKAFMASWLVGFGGQPINEYAELDSFGFGRLEAGKTKLMVNVLRAPLDYDGLLGADFLLNFNLDFDFANAKLNLFKTEKCDGNKVYWTKGTFGEVHFEKKNYEIAVPVKVNGKTVKALLDTGAMHSVMSMETAESIADFDKKTVKEGEPVKIFTTLSFGDVTVNNPVIELVSDKNSKVLGEYGRQDMLIGMDVLRRLHVYIDYDNAVIYVTPATQY